MPWTLLCKLYNGPVEDESISRTAKGTRVLSKTQTFVVSMMRLSMKTYLLFTAMVATWISSMLALHVLSQRLRVIDIA